MCFYEERDREFPDGSQEDLWSMVGGCPGVRGVFRHRCPLQSRVWLALVEMRVRGSLVVAMVGFVETTRAPVVAGVGGPVVDLERD